MKVKNVKKIECQNEALQVRGVLLSPHALLLRVVFCKKNRKCFWVMDAVQKDNFMEDNRKSLSL